MEDDDNDAILRNDTSEIKGIWPWSDNQEICVRIQNTVCTCLIGTSLVLSHLVTQLKHYAAQYNKKRFAAVIIEFKNPKVAFLIFAQGKIVCTGAKNPYRATCLIHRIVDEIQKLGYVHAKVTNLHVENMVASACFPWKIDQEKLSSAYSDYCNYDPEQFPGVIMRYPPISPITVLIFNSGRAVFAGLKRVEDIYTALDHIPQLIKTAMDSPQQPPQSPLPIAVKNMISVIALEEITKDYQEHLYFERATLKDRCKSIHRRQRRKLSIVNLE